MFRHSVRRMATSAAKAAKAARSAQELSVHPLIVGDMPGVAKGLTGGMFGSETFSRVVSRSVVWSRRFSMLYSGLSCRVVYWVHLAWFLSALLG